MQDRNLTYSAEEQIPLNGELTFDQIRQALSSSAGNINVLGARFSGVAPVKGLIEPRNQRLILLKGRLWAVELRARSGLAPSALGLPAIPTAGELAILGMHLVRRAAAAKTAQATSGLRARWCLFAKALLKGRRP